MSLNPRALGLSLGIIGGAWIFIITLFAVATGYGTAGLVIFGSFHPGYTITIAGAFIGLSYSFICWFLAGYALAWLHNTFEQKL